MRVKSCYRYIPLFCIFILLSPARGAGPKNVLVVINDKSPVSREIGAYYIAKRKIPAKNVVHIKCQTTEAINDKLYPVEIEKPVMQYLEKNGLKKTIDYLVLTKGIPIKTYSAKSVDGLLMCADLGIDVQGLKQGVPNPYYDQTSRFSRAKYGFYLATRLDGYTVKDAKSLVNRALTAKPEKGVFLFDTTPKRNSGGYALMNMAMSQAQTEIVRKGFIALLDKSEEFAGGRKNLMGYFSWGSNDVAFDVKKYKSNRFCPGAIAETVVSTSARTLSRSNDGGQSLIADLIEAGITGVKGYVSEPTIGAVADPRILFDRYLSGFNLAESFYAASRWILWKDLVIGDPLCAPYEGIR